MAETIIDRGGSIGPEPIASQQPDTMVARSGGWGNIALLSAGIGVGACNHSSLCSQTERLPAQIT